MASPTVTLDKPWYVRGDTITATVVYDPFSLELTATAPNGESTTVEAVLRAAFVSDPTAEWTRVSDDGHTAVFTTTA